MTTGRIHNADLRGEAEVRTSMWTLLLVYAFLQAPSIRSLELWKELSKAITSWRRFSGCGGADKAEK